MPSVSGLKNAHTKASHLGSKASTIHASRGGDVEYLIHQLPRLICATSRSFYEVKVSS